jgi:hypothetical protein
MTATGLGTAGGHLQPIEQGVAYVTGKGATVGVEDRLLKGEDHRQPIDEARHPTGPTLAPGPHLGRDVKEHRDAAAVGLSSHKLIETRVIHQHHRIGAVPIHLQLEITHHPPVARDAAGDLH